MKNTASTATSPQMAADSLTQPGIKDPKQKALSSPSVQIIRSPHKKNYSVIANVALEDSRLSHTALAILINRIRKPDRKFVVPVVAKELKRNVCTIRKYLRQLIDLGYLDRQVFKNASGQYAGHDYLLTEKVTDLYMDMNQVDVTSKAKEAL